MLDRRIQVEIGDSKQVEFYPQTKLMFWHNECNFSARLTGLDERQAVVNVEVEKTTWVRSDVEARFFEKPDEHVDGEDKAYEFEVVLKEPPASNVLTFSLQTKELDFWYQGELTEEEVKAGDYRPEHVVGSYAVYHKSKKNGQYGTGKAFHVYRPWAEDANGERVWCDLNIDAGTGVMTITLPEEFHAKAQYPVLVDPTFGYTTAPATESTWTGNRMYGMTGTPSEGGPVESISVYTRVTTGSGNIKAVLVDKASANIVSNGVGGTVAVTSTSASWRTAQYTYSARPVVAASTAYYVCAVGDSGMDYGKFYFDNTGSSGDALIDTSNSYTTPTNPTDLTTQARQYGFYATFLKRRYWVGGGASANWNATGNTNWSLTSGGSNNASVPDTDTEVFFDGVGGGASNSTLSAAITICSLDCTGYTNTLTHNASVTLTISGLVFKLAAGMTYTLGNATTSAVTFTSTSGTTALTGGGKTVGNIVLNGSGGTFQIQDTFTSSGSFTRTNGTFDGNAQTLALTGTAPTITGATTFYNLTRTGTAAKTDTLAFANDVTVTGTFTVNGNSSVNRVLVTSNTLGTARTITAATVSVTNADFRDITGAGAGSWDLSAITGLSGDCGGNSGITFTTGATQYWVGNTGSWSTAAKWGTTSGGSGGRVPLPQDNARFDANSFTLGSRVVTLDMPRAGKDIDFTGVTNTPDLALAGSSSAFVIYGSLTMVSGMTNSNTTSAMVFEGRGSHTLTSAGKTFSFQTLTINMFGGTLTLQDAYATGNKPIQVLNGTFNANGFNVTCATFTVANTSGVTITMGTGTWTLTGTDVLISLTGDTLPTISATGSTLAITNISTTSKTLALGGRSWGNLTISGDNVIITGANSFATLAVNNAGLPNGLKLTSGVTQTVTALTTNGSAGNLAILQSTSAGSAATISKASGTVSVDYMSIKDSTATGGATFYAGANSTNVSGNTGWIFTAPGGAEPLFKHPDPRLIGPILAM